MPTQPFGRVLLGLIALGFFGFVGGRVAQGVFNADRGKRDLKNGVARIGKLVSAASYLSLGLFAGGVALGLAGGSSGAGSEESWTARLLGLPFGPILVGALGAGIITGGAGNIWKALSGAYHKRLDIPAKLPNALLPICTFGIAARGVVFLILGGFLVYAALTVRPEAAGGIGEALDWVRSLPFGGVLYIAVALGLLAFAGSCAVYMLYRRIETPDAGNIGDAARQAVGAARMASPGLAQPGRGPAHDAQAMGVRLRH